jgi:hypothetical protein
MKSTQIVISITVEYPNTLAEKEALEIIEQDLNGKGTLKDGLLYYTICSDGSITLKNGEIIGIQ